MYNFIDKIVTQFEETQENFIFETIYPFCKEVTKCEISKEELTNALLFWRAITKEHKTNGDMIKAMFPNVKIHQSGGYTSCLFQPSVMLEDTKSDWWNAPYKAESSETKQGLAYADQDTMMPAT